MITETWFGEYSVVNLCNYKLYCKNRLITRGGGVAIYVRKDIESYDIGEHQLMNLRSEQVWCRIKVGEESVIVGCVYRPPLSDCGINLEICESISFASSMCSSNSASSLLVAGDFNFPDILWYQFGGLCKNKGRPSSLEFLDCMHRNYLTQHVLEPTFKGNTLDLILTDDPARIFRVRSGPPLGSSEKDCLHSSLTWKYELRSKPSVASEATPRPVYSNGNYARFKDLFLEGCASFLDSPSDCDSSYNQLVNAYASASSLAIPTRAHKARIHTNPKWFSPTIKALTRRKSKLHYLCRAAPLNPDLKAEYNQICKQVKLAVRRAVCRFEALIVRSCKHQPKLLYNYINSQKACRDSIKGLMDSGGTYQTDGRIIANLLNDYFSSVFSVRSAEPIPTLPLRVKCQMLSRHGCLLA